MAAVLSYAGRVADPRAQPVPIRIGGFGGVPGLANYLRENAVTHLVDATHPFAAQISLHAVQAATETGTPLLAFVRPEWRAEPKDRWLEVPDIAAAAQALAGPPQRVFLAIGRLHLADFASQPQHHYLVRLVDPPEAPLPLPQTTLIVARGPFNVAAERTLLRIHEIETIIAKNAGGSGAEAKILAARALGLQVILIARPWIPPRVMAGCVAEVLEWLDHPELRGV